MNGSVVICDDNKVVSTNKQELTSRSIEAAKSLYKNQFKADVNRIVRLHSKNGIWYGRQKKIKDYDAYIFFPKYQVYITRNTVMCDLCAACTTSFFTYRVSRSRTEKKKHSAGSEETSRDQCTWSCIFLYFSCEYKNRGNRNRKKLQKNMKPDQEGHMLSKAHQEELIRQVIAEPFQEAYREFIDMSTVAKRLEKREMLSSIAQTADERWLTMIIVPQGYDKDGKLCTVLVANRDVTEEKEREIEQDKNLRNALAVAEHANRAKTAFLNNMSHDIRTPMNAVIGFTALATTHIDNKELVLDYLKRSIHPVSICSV